MSTRTFQWTPLAQARRIASVDTRVSAIDMGFGLLYVLAGFFMKPDMQHMVHVVVAPFVILSGVLLYLAARVCEPEGTESTAMFYANLPRSRNLAFWTHVAWLTAFALTMEIFIGMGVMLRLNAGLPGQHFVVTPFCILLPFLAIACGLYKAYFHHFVTSRIFVDIFLWISLVIIFLFILIPAEYSLQKGIKQTGHINLWTYFSPAAGLALMTLFLMGYLYHRWMRIQVGEK